MNETGHDTTPSKCMQIKRARSRKTAPLLSRLVLVNLAHLRRLLQNGFLLTGSQVDVTAFVFVFDRQFFVND